MQHHFSNAMQWYTTLIDYKNLCIRDYLDQIRETIIQAPVEVDSQNFGKSFNVLY
jgi:hypothetical protein